MQAFRVIDAEDISSPNDGIIGFELQIDESGVENPNDSRELLLIKKDDYRGRQRIGLFRNLEWLVQGYIRSGKIQLFREN